MAPRPEAPQVYRCGARCCGQYRLPARHLLAARRLERERLGRRLHRGPLQDILLLLQLLPPGSVAAAAATRVATSLRAILTETGSAALRDLGLPAALRAYATYLAPYVRARHYVLTVAVDDAAGALAADESFALFHLAQEALVNALRHSGGRRIHLRLQVEREDVVLEVCDDGRGLPRGWAELRLDHRGLRDALDIVRTVRAASAMAESLATGGTVIRARVPLRRRATRRSERCTARTRLAC